MIVTEKVKSIVGHTEGCVRSDRYEYSQRRGKEKVGRRTKKAISISAVWERAAIGHEEYMGGKQSTGSPPSE